MANERCPSCGAAVRAGDPWCTLCWADLRPEPVRPASPDVPASTAPPLAAPPEAVGGLLVATVDPLTAPLPVVLGEAPPAPPAATWPCVECGAQNALDLDACGVCTAPFGGRIARLDDPKAQRRKLMVCALGAVGAFLMFLALLTFASTNTTTTDGSTSLEPQIDWSSVPRD